MPNGTLLPILALEPFSTMSIAPILLPDSRDRDPLFHAFLPGSADGRFVALASRRDESAARKTKTSSARFADGGGKGAPRLGGNG